MRITGNVLIALSLFAAATSVRAEDKLKSTDRTVTISGCVVAAEQPDSFMLKDVTQLSNGWRAPLPNDGNGANVLYWLNTTAGLSSRVGQRVEVTGTVDFKDAHKGQTKITVDPNEKKDTKTELSSAGRKVTTKEDTPAIPKLDDAEKAKLKIPAAAAYDLHVKSLKTVPGTCSSGE